MTIELLLKFIAGIQGAYVLAVAFLILSHYAQKNSVISKNVRYHIITISLSHICLTGCTIVSVFVEAYPMHHIWYKLAMGGWLLSAISLTFMLRRIIKLRNEKRLNNFLNKNK
jgi:hypothetical protein